MSGEEISVKQVRRLAGLAKIELSKKEEELYVRQLREILEYFRKIDEAEIEDVPPTYHGLELEDVFRPDEVEGFDADEILKGVPRREGRNVKAPRMM